jgi:hypothetical protein
VTLLGTTQEPAVEEFAGPFVLVLEAGNRVCPQISAIPAIKIARVNIKDLKNEDEPLRAWFLDFRLKKV